MKILLIGDYLPDAKKSMPHFVEMLQKRLIELGHQVRIIKAEAYFGRLLPSPVGWGKWLGYIDKFLIFPGRLNKEKHWADVVHVCDHAKSYYIKYLRDMPNIVTCHDLLAVRSALGEFKENPVRWTGHILQGMILNGLKQAQHIICISESTRIDLLRITGINHSRVSVIPYGLNYPYFALDKTEARKILENKGYHVHEPFILHVGLEKWYKNRAGVLKIFNGLHQIKGMGHFNLVMAGSPLYPPQLKTIENWGWRDSAFSIVSPEKEVLHALYSTASALLFPSLYEGFGWPIIEAQACGCPVFTTKRPPMTEIGGQAAIYIDPHAPIEAAGVISAALNDPSKISGMREAGFLNLKRFSDEQMARDYVKVYEKVIREKGEK